MFFDSRYGKIICMKKGSIDIRNLLSPPQKHELHTARFFSEMGYDIIFIRPSNIPDNHRPDFVMNGIEWEVKSPTGRSRHSIEKRYSDAKTQSGNIIFDLRRCNLSDKECISVLQKQFYAHHSKRLLIITKSEKLLEFPPNCLDK